MAESVVGATVAAALVSAPNDVDATVIDDGYLASFWINARTGASFAYWWRITKPLDPTFILQGASDTALNAAIALNAQLAVIFA